MLLSFVRNLVHRRSGERQRVGRPRALAPLRLHVGGQIPHPDWKILDVRPGPHVDYVGHCTDLTEFDDASVTEIYASHVIEHLGYMRELPTALREFNRVLIPGGIARIGVPDLPTLCALYLDPEMNSEDRYQIMRIMYGGQRNEADFHNTGFNEELLKSYLEKAGFADVARVDNFGLFDDNSRYAFKGRPISLNVCARKPPAP